MNQPTNLSELESIITTLIVDAKCTCHFINPHKTRILMWKLKDNTFHLRIGIQKFTSQEQIDRNGETYWRYYNCEKEPTPLDSVTKFQQRQEKVKDYAKANLDEQSTNSQSN